MVSVKKSMSLKPDGGIWKSQTTDIVDLESTVTILTTQVFGFGMCI